MEIVILITVGCMLLLIVTLYLINYILEFKARIRQMKMEIRRSYNERERNHWKRELSAVRWSIIPGITPEKVKRLRKDHSHKK